MKKWTALLTAVMIAGCAHTQHRLKHDQAVTLETLPPAVKAISTYTFGQSREPLTVVEDLVREAAASPDQSRALAAQLAFLLATDATHEAKQFVCKQLVFIGGPENVPALAPLLLKEDSADMARYALQPIAGPEVDKALVAALAQAPESVKAGIINSLGMRRTKSAVKALKPLAQSPNAEVAAAAKAALERIGE